MREETNEVVVFETLCCANSSVVAIAQLNTPQTLNGLSLEMTRLLATQLDQWAQDPDVALVILRGAGDKAFCAGGDLHTLHHHMKKSTSGMPEDNPYAATFFAEEYALDYRIHTYPKPILVWGDGIVMGGGMGLMMGASHRVVTETTRMAMPEISIGLFPDVGGTWLLNRLPGQSGLFLGLTGAQLGPSDALFANMADYHLLRDRWHDLLTALTEKSWAKVSEQADQSLSDHALTQLSGNHDQLDTVLSALCSAPSEGVKPLQTHFSLLRQVCRGSNLEQIVQNILALSQHPDVWLQRAAKTLAQGSPGSIRLTYTLLKHNKYLSLAEVYRVEWFAGLMAAAHGDFAEGIRALLIDKDKKPQWNPSTLAQADTTWVKKFLTLPFPAERHPLYRLGVTE